MQLLKYSYALFPNAKDENFLRQCTGHNRHVWNHFLDEEKKEYAENQKFRFYYKNCKDLTTLKKSKPWLKDVPAVSLQCTLRNLNIALLNSFPNKGKTRRGFPRPKYKSDATQSFTLTMVSTKTHCKSNAFKIPGYGWIKCKYHRPLPSDFKSCQIKFKSGRWHVVFTVKKEKALKRSIITHIGIDLNSKDVVLSTGEKILTPKYLRENQTKIKKLQRILSKKQKGSQNRIKAKAKLRKVHNHVKNKRADYCHKLSRSLVDSYDLISTEDLNVKQMQQWNGRIIQDNIFASLRHQLVYKSELSGKTVFVCDRYYASTKTCSSCGSKYNIALHQRTYDCPACGFTYDRDINAAINIDRAGMAQLNACGITKYAHQVLIGALLSNDEAGSYVQ